MSNGVDKLTPKELGLPDPTQAGNLIFAAYCDVPKLVNIFKLGIKPGNGKPESASYFPNVISLSAISDKGYAGTDSISMGWYNIIQNAKLFGHIYIDHAFCYSLILDQEWIEKNIEKFIGVGGAFRDHETAQILKVGPLTNLPVQENIDIFSGAYYTEVHFKEGIIPPKALKGILVDEEIGDSIEADMNIGKAIEEIKKGNFNIKFPIGIYTKKGQLVELIG